MSPKVQRKRRGDKPAKPHRDYPLTVNGNGQWSKKIRGKVHYFGPWADPDAALERYLEVKDDLLAGRRPRPRDGFTLRDLCNHFLTAKKRQLDGSEITPRTFHDYHRVCERVLEALDGNRLVEDLAPEEFGRLRDKLAETMGPVALGNEISRTRVVFRFRVQQRPCGPPNPLRCHFQTALEASPSHRTPEEGLRMFEAEELRKMLKASEGQLKAMILLGINCGFGNHDCATLPRSALNLDSGWVRFPRPKTGIDRRVPLWAETVDAVREAMKVRPQPKDEEEEGLVFVTKYGHRWVRTSLSTKTEGKLVACDSIAQEVRKLMKQLGISVGRNFYALRHTFETIGGEARDQIAVDAIMGHARDDMASVYRERISDERLIAVSNHVREWLFGDSRSEANQATD